MEFSFTVETKVTMEHKPGWTTSRHKHTDFRLALSKGLDRKMYFGPDDLPTKDGTKAATLALVSGLAANIHQGHQKGFWDSAEHMRYAIAELERQFATVAKVYTGTM